MNSAEFRLKTYEYCARDFLRPGNVQQLKFTPTLDPDSNGYSKGTFEFKAVAVSKDGSVGIAEYGRLLGKITVARKAILVDFIRQRLTQGVSIEEIKIRNDIGLDVE